MIVGIIVSMWNLFNEELSINFYLLPQRICSFIHKFTHQFNSNLWSAYYVSGIILGFLDVSVNKTKIPVLTAGEYI